MMPLLAFTLLLLFVSAFPMVLWWLALPLVWGCAFFVFEALVFLPMVYFALRREAQQLAEERRLFAAARAAEAAEDELNLARRVGDYEPGSLGYLIRLTDP